MTQSEGSQDLAKSAPTLRPIAAVLVADDEARFCEVNAAATALLQYSESQLLSMHVWDITALDQGADARALWQAFMKAGNQAGMYQVRRADGRRLTVQYEARTNFRPGRHLSVLRPISGPLAESRPLDECPFERPFPADFDLCPAYQPVHAAMADSNERPVGSVWTCGHLSATGIKGYARFYGRCRLGDALARNRSLLAGPKR